MILTLHGRKGLLVTAKLALLDTRFKEYQHPVIGTVLTTLHAGSVLLTFYPNFNLSLSSDSEADLADISKLLMVQQHQLLKK